MKSNKKKDIFKSMSKDEAIKVLLNSKEEEREMEDLMSPYFIDYSMDVIQNRALPDVRDGLKPVHRRIMYALHDLGIFNNKPYKKCARVVGEVIGKYNPHGDSSAYQALVKMAQDFYMRYPLIEGHGNFGSSDGDNAAAQRYTECRMEKLGDEMTKDLDKNVVTFRPNFDGEEIEPEVLPCRYPNLLCNGTYGIATFTSNIPSHNIVQAINQTIYQIDNPNCTIEELVDILQAPDYPTGATIINKKDLLNLYKNGKGSLTIRAKYHIEDDKIVFTELPTGSMKENIYRNVIKCFKGYSSKKVIDGKTKTVFNPPTIPQIRDITDESDGEDTRLIIEVKNSKEINKVLKLLFKNKDIGLQISESYHFTFLKGNKLYEEQDLKTINKLYIEHQQEVIKNRTKFLLSNYKKDEELYKGYSIVLSNVDKAVEIIKKSKSKIEAKDNLINYYSISEKQALAVLKLDLAKLTGMEIDNILNRLKKIEEEIKALQLILDDENRLNEVLKKELTDIKNKYGDARRTEILDYDDLGSLSKSELIEEYNCKIAYTPTYIKKYSRSTDSQKTKENETLIEVDIDSNNTDTLLVFTNKGNRYKIGCHELQTVIASKSLGDYVYNITTMDKDEQIIKVVSIPKDYKKDSYIICVFENGNISKVPVEQFLSNNRKLMNCYNTESKLLSIDYITKDVDVLMVSSEGKGLIFNSIKCNSKQSRNTKGVRGMKISDDMTIVGTIINVNEDYNFKLTTDKGKEKEVYLNDVVSNNDDRQLYSYLRTTTIATKGNFILNTRTNNDRITNFEIL